MVLDVAGLARLLDDLVVAKSVYDLVKLGHNPSTLYRRLGWLVEHGFVNVIDDGGVRRYHLTGLGARLYEVLMEALLYRATRLLEERGVRNRVWWGDERVRAVRPVIYVDRKVEIPLNLEGLVEVRLDERAAKH
ncbi:MAG: hypothetical protein F7C07_02280 [Desulfurococcales archaeon]|nr:hypothetical protein [Desulfurococcales archaeon]